MKFMEDQAPTDINDAWDRLQPHIKLPEDNKQLIDLLRNAVGIRNHTYGVDKDLGKCVKCSELFR
jgi:hypothetical protein